MIFMGTNTSLPPICMAKRRATGSARSLWRELKEKDGSTKRKFVVYFEGVEKALVLNKTNAQKLAAAFGKDHSKWIGMEVELYAEMTGLGKEGVRVRPLKPTGASDLNDTINF